MLQIHALPSTSSEEELESFYQTLGTEYDKETHQYKVSMGDFNSRVGKREAYNIVAGGHGLGQRNERGHRLVEFAECTNMYITKNFFKRNPQRKWVWICPSGTENEMDHILNKL